MSFSGWTHLLTLLLQSQLTVSDITFKNIWGTTNNRFNPLVGHIVCSSPHTCWDVVAEDIEIRSPNGTDLLTCLNMDNSLLDINCTTWSKGYNKA